MCTRYPQYRGPTSQITAMYVHVYVCAQVAKGSGSVYPIHVEIACQGEVCVLHCVCVTRCVYVCVYSVCVCV